MQAFIPDHKVHCQHSENAETKTVPLLSSQIGCLHHSPCYQLQQNIFDNNHGVSLIVVANNPLRKSLRTRDACSTAPIRAVLPSSHLRTAKILKTFLDGSDMLGRLVVRQDQTTRVINHLTTVLWLGEGLQSLP